MDELVTVHLTLYNPRLPGQAAKKLDPKAWSAFHRTIRDLITSGGGEEVGIWLSAINAPQQSIVIKAELPADTVHTIRASISEEVAREVVPTSWLQGDEDFFI